MPALPLRDLAEKYGVDATKPFFPVNSLRLFYSIINEYATQGSMVTNDAIGLIIPQIEAIVQARSDHRANSKTATLESDFETVEPLLAKLFELIDTPVVRGIFAQQITFLNPIQDEFFLSSYQEILGQDKLSVTHLTLLLRIRAMDSILFSTVLAELWRQSDTPPTPPLKLSSLHHHFNLLYQLNDLVDTVVFARDDLQAGNFSPFKVIQKIAPEPAEAKELITNLFSEFITQA
jgi:hypothetical protein